LQRLIVQLLTNSLLDHVLIDLDELRRDDIPQVNSLENKVLTHLLINGALGLMLSLGVVMWDSFFKQKGATTRAKQVGQLSGLKAVNMKMLLCAFEFSALEKQKLKNINMYNSLVFWKNRLLQIDNKKKYRLTKGGKH
ncbi:hypothetical protein ACJX0J_013210, partial [Zea mays]